MIFKGFKLSMTLAMILNATAGWVRLASGNSYKIALIGQVIAALGQNFDLPSPVCKLIFCMIYYEKWRYCGDLVPRTRKDFGCCDWNIC